MKITLYPQKFALVNTSFRIELKKGINTIKIDKIPETIDKKSIILDFLKIYDASIKSYSFKNDVLLLEILSLSDHPLCEVDFYYKVLEIEFENFYNFLYLPIENSILMDGWITIKNNILFKYENTDLQLVHNYKDQNIIFSIDGKYDISNGTDTLSFISLKIPIKKKLLVKYDSNVAKECVFFKNSIENNLGNILMPGKTTVNFKDGDGHLQFLGQDNFGLYLPDEDIEFEIGDADELIEIERDVDDNLFTHIFTNLTDQILEIEAEFNTFGGEISENNAVFEIRENYIGVLKMKLLPKENKIIKYKITPNEIEMPI